jgi:hypothetical protein
MIEPVLCRQIKGNWSGINSLNIFLHIFLPANHNT